MHSHLAILLPLLAAAGTVLAAPTPMRPKVEVWDEPWKGASCSGHDCSIKREALKLPPGPGQQSPWFAPWATDHGPIGTREAKEQQQPPSGESPWFAPWKHDDDGPVIEPPPGKPKPGPPSGETPWYAPWNPDGGSAAASKRAPQRDRPHGTPWYFDWTQEEPQQKREPEAERPHGTPWNKDWSAAPVRRADDEDTGRKLWTTKWN